VKPRAATLCSSSNSRQQQQQQQQEGLLLSHELQLHVLGHQTMNNDSWEPAAGTAIPFLACSSGASLSANSAHVPVATAACY
jgi:hypothetical protein